MDNKSRTEDFIIVIGASTGGTEAIFNILKALPAKMPPILAVLHMPPVFTKMYAERLNKFCELNVKEGENGEPVEPGKVLIAPGDHHMTIERGMDGLFVRCKKGEKVNGHCPSVDVLFESAAKCMGKNALGIILTGMGGDGAKGLLKMKNAGAYTLGQDEASCVVYGMPMEAYKIGAVSKQASLDDMPAEILKWVDLKGL